MATYINGVTDYVPEIQQFKPDFNFYQSVLTIKQAKYDQGLQQVSSLYGSALDLDLTREDNQLRKQEFFKDIEGGIKKLAGLDLSLKQNVEQAYGLFGQFLNDKEIQHDAYFTKTSKDELQRAEAYRSCFDTEECGGMWWQGGVELINLSLDEYRNASPEKALIMTPQQFIPAQDVYKIATDYIKDLKIDKEIEYIDESKTFVVRDKNGDIVDDDIVKVLNGVLWSDPKIQEFFTAQQKLDRLRFVNAHKDEYGSESIANAAYYGMTQQKYINSLVSENAELQKKYNDSKTTPTDKQKLLDLIEQNKRDIKRVKEENSFLLNLATVANGGAMMVENPLGIDDGTTPSTPILSKIEEYMKIGYAIDAAEKRLDYLYQMAINSGQYIDGYSTSMLDSQLANTAFLMFSTTYAPTLADLWSIRGIKNFNAKYAAAGGVGGSISRNSDGTYSYTWYDNGVKKTAKFSSKEAAEEYEHKLNESRGEGKGTIGQEYKFGGSIRKYQIGGPFEGLKPNARLTEEPNNQFYKIFGNVRNSGTFNFQLNPDHSRNLYFKRKDLSPTEYMQKYDFEGRKKIYSSGNEKESIFEVPYETENGTVDIMEVSSAKIDEYRKIAFPHFYGVTHPEWYNAKYRGVWSVNLWNQNASPSVYKDLSQNTLLDNYIPINIFKTLDTDVKNDYGRAGYRNYDSVENASNNYSYNSFRDIVKSQLFDYQNNYNTAIDAIEGAINSLFVYDSKAKTYKDIEQTLPDGSKQYINHDELINQFRNTFNTEQNKIAISDAIDRINRSDFTFQTPVLDLNFLRTVDDRTWKDTVSLIGNLKQFENLISMLGAQQDIQTIIERTKSYNSYVLDSLEPVFDELDEFAYAKDASYKNGMSYNVGNENLLKGKLIRNFVYFTSNGSNTGNGELLFASSKNYKDLISSDGAKLIASFFSDENIDSPQEGNANVNRLKGRPSTEEDVEKISLTPVEIAMLHKSDYTRYWTESGLNQKLKDASGETDVQKFFSSISTAYNNAVHHVFGRYVLNDKQIIIDNESNVHINDFKIDGYDGTFNIRFTPYGSFDVEQAQKPTTQLVGPEGKVIEVEKELNDEDWNNINKYINDNVRKSLFEDHINFELDRGYTLGTISDMDAARRGKKERVDFEPNWSKTIGVASNLGEVEGTEDVSFGIEELGWVFSHLYGRAFMKGAKSLIDFMDSANIGEDYGSKVYKFDLDYSKLEKSQTDDKHSYTDLNQDVVVKFFNDFLNSATNEDVANINTMMIYRKENTTKTFPFIDQDQLEKAQNSSNWTSGKIAKISFDSQGVSVTTNTDEIRNIIAQYKFIEDKNDKYTIRVTPIANNDQRYIGISIDSIDGKKLQQDVSKDTNTDGKKELVSGYQGLTIYIPYEKVKNTEFARLYRDNVIQDYVTSTDEILIPSSMNNSEIKFTKEDRGQGFKWYVANNAWVTELKPEAINVEGGDKFYKSKILELGDVDNNISPDIISDIYNRVFMYDQFKNGLTDDEMIEKYPLILKYIANQRRMSIKIFADRLSSARFQYDITD